MTETVVQAGIAPDLGGESIVDKIAKVEAFCVELPYRGQVNFRAVSESKGQYVLLRLTTHDGAEGISESVARLRQNGEDARALAYDIDTFFAPLLAGADPLAHNHILAEIGRIKGCRSAKALIDVALWDLKGKLLGQPVWRLLGGGPVKPVPLTWIVHGDSTEAMVEQACRMVEERGFKALKLKTWKRSVDDVVMVREVRKAMGDDIMIYVDANGTYLETEARTILGRLDEYNIAFIEEPCSFPDPRRMAAMAAALPVALLGDQTCESLEAVNHLVSIHAVGAVSVKPRRTGITESLKIIALCEAAGLPVVIGTGSESPIGTMSRIHLHTAMPWLHPWPTEMHFFEKLADDVAAGEFPLKDGMITPTDAPGFGVALDMAKIKKYAI
ncbi:MAG: hypothetical protein IH903_00095 [Proteobacteria bacterium]|nr:hypothetical protein [Pseudomonadota bacterium]